MSDNCNNNAFPLSFIIYWWQFRPFSTTIEKTFFVRSDVVIAHLFSPIILRRDSNVRAIYKEPLSKRWINFNSNIVKQLHVIYKMKLYIHFQTSTVLLQFGNKDDITTRSDWRVISKRVLGIFVSKRSTRYHCGFKMWSNTNIFASALYAIRYPFLELART